MYFYAIPFCYCSIVSPKTQTNNLFRSRIFLHDAEGVAFGVFEVSEPTNRRDRHLTESFSAASGFDLFYIFVNIWHINSADEGTHWLKVFRHFAPPYNHTAVNTRPFTRLTTFCPLFCHHHPISILFRHIVSKLPLLKLPTKNICIKLSCSLWVTRMYFKMYHS